MNDEVLKFIIERVLKNALEQEDESSQFGQGKKLAFYETLDIIKSELIIHDLLPEEFGLNFELEKLL